METQVRSSREDDSFQEASRVIQRGGLVAFPTETVYGLGGDALLEDAAKKIYAAKGRPSDNPLIVHIADKQDLCRLAVNIPQKAWNLAEAFWPGSLTLVLEKSSLVPLGTTGGLQTVAVRMPNHPVALRLIRESGRFLAAPSANTSGRPSPTLASHVLEDLNGRIDMILDGGMVQVGLESTIVDVTEEQPVILRPGCITKSMLEKVVGPVKVDPAIISQEGAPVGKPKAPGMKYKHYAPKADMTIFAGEKAAVVKRICKETQKAVAAGLQVGILASDETRAYYSQGQVLSIGSREEPGSIARGLYGCLRDFDHMEADVIFAESFEDDGLGDAIMNRMKKAAGYAIVQVSPEETDDMDCTQ